MAGGGESAPAEAETNLECFDFAFNSEKFSDRLLRIEVVASDDVAEESLPDGKDKGHKRQRIDSSPTMIGTPVLRVKTLHINSAILAARSAFFLKLFSNGMKESDQTHPTIRIVDSEEHALLELLSFMYSGKLTTTEPSLLLDILMAADKFEVPSCMRHCSQLLISLPMTTESALLYLDHGCSILLAAEVQCVIGAAKQFIAKTYRDFDKFRDEAMNFSLAAIEAIFSSTDIHVRCEEQVFHFLLRWARTRYLESEERREILNSRLLTLVRFSHMAGTSLQWILTLTDTDIDHEEVTKRITEVLLRKGYPAQLEGALAADAERAYTMKPMKVVAFDQPCRQVIVYWDLTCQECSRLHRSGRKLSGEIFSYPFNLAGQKFCLVTLSGMDEQNKLQRIGLILWIHREPKGSTCITVDYEFAVRTDLTGKFVSQFDRKHTITYDPAREGKGPLGTVGSWFSCDDRHFINDVLHLRADITVVEQPVLQT